MLGDNMENQELLQQVLNNTLERFARQTANYEAEIANLNAQIFLYKDQIEKNNKTEVDVDVQLDLSKRCYYIKRSG